jgi:fatty acid desaturase
VSESSTQQGVHRELIRSLSAQQRRALTQKSNVAGFKALFIHCGAIGVITWLIVERVYLWQLLLPIQGVLLVFLFTLMHESIHRTAFASKAINDVVASCCALILGLPATWFREFHMAHHRHTQDKEKDPELLSAKPETPQQYFWHLTGIPIWYSHIKTMLRNAMGKCDDAYVSVSRHKAVSKEARWMLLAYVALAMLSLWFGSSLLLYIWLIPAMLGQPFLRLYLLAEHGRCAFVSNAFENTRTTFTNKLVRQLAWNMPYHAEHHAYPMVPFFRLGDFHELVKDHLSVTERGYARFNKQYLADIAPPDSLSAK